MDVMWENFAENKKRAQEVIDSLANPEAYSKTFKNGMYYGVLVALNAQTEEENREKLTSEISYEKLKKLSFFKRLIFLFTKNI